MIDSEKSARSAKSSLGYATKKCPNCYTHLPLRAKVCTSCHVRVGDVDKLGFAEKPIDWRAYLIAAVAIAAFAIFTWWAFFQE